MILATVSIIVSSYTTYMETIQYSTPFTYFFSLSISMKKVTSDSNYQEPEDYSWSFISLQYRRHNFVGLVSGFLLYIVKRIDKITYKK